MTMLGDVPRSGIREEDLAGLSPEQLAALEPLLRYINTSVQGLAQTLSRNVSLSDNVRNEIQTVPLSHGVAQIISLKKLKQAKGVRSLSVGSADGKTQHALAQPLHLIGTTSPGQVKVLAYFLDATAIRVPVTLELTPEGSYTALTPSTGTWTAPTLTNSWANLGGAAITTGYLKDSLGFIHLRGTVANGTAGATITTLPVGFRPVAEVYFRVRAWNGAAEVQVSITVASDGTVKDKNSAIGGAGQNLSFDGITFDTRS